MDLAFALLLLCHDPVEVDRNVAIFPGPQLPFYVPVAGMSDQQRFTWLFPRHDVAIADRVRYALEANHTTAAWHLVENENVPIVGYLDQAIVSWSGRELAQMHVDQHGHFFMAIGNSPQTLANDAGWGLECAHDMLSSLPWPRWGGPLLIVMDDAGKNDPAPGQRTVVRPGLPIIRYPAKVEGTSPAEQLGGEIAVLALDLTAAPPAGWPEWLRVGVMEVAKAKVRGLGPSPMKMLAIRQKAGKQAIIQLFASNQPAPELAMAVCAPLVHTKRRGNLPNFLDSLRHQIDVEAALHLAYGLSIDDLLEEH